MYQQMKPYSNENRQFNIPGLIGGLFGFPSGGPYYGQPPGLPYPTYPGGQSPWQQAPPQQTGGPPTSPPPAFQPTQPGVQTFAVDPGAIQGCLFRFTYVWLNRDSFWFYPVFVGRNSVAGYRWRRNRWVYFGIDLNQIQSFQCF
ncbi:MAG TPA: hypothetical protein VK072_00690 [Candidatus Avamphibacillus sp.]|nr:hypothetical protein [Candidatus Avamphibacillus sp.]